MVLIKMLPINTEINIFCNIKKNLGKIIDRFNDQNKSVVIALNKNNLLSTCTCIYNTSGISQHHSGLR